MRELIATILRGTAYEVTLCGDAESALVRTKDETPFDTVVLTLTPFRRTIRNYFAVCDSYYNAIRSATPAQIETVDMARRSLHNDGAEMLKERLEEENDYLREEATAARGTGFLIGESPALKKVLRPASTRSRGLRVSGPARSTAIFPPATR